MKATANKASPADIRPNPPRPAGQMTARASIQRGLILAGTQFCVLVIISIFFAIFDLDRAIASIFYRPEEKWFMGRDGLWVWLYRYGTIPGLLLTLGCLIAWLVTCFNRRLLPWRPYFLLVVLTTVIAAGILVNAVLKPYWGRPRPNQTTEFGGYYTYRHVFPPGVPGQGASFPCGHCTMGFTFLSLYFVRRHSKALAYSGVTAGLVMGALLSAARVVKGAHFMSDAIWSLGIISMTAVTLYYCILKIPASQPASRPSGLTGHRKIGLITIGCLAVLLITGAFMTRRPIFRTTKYYPPITSATKNLMIQLNADPEKLVVGYKNQDQSVVLVHTHGFGWAYFDYSIRHEYQQASDNLTLRIQIEPRSYFAELNHTLEVVLAASQRDRLKVWVNPD